jgi:hypothetical protein
MGNKIYETDMKINEVRTVFGEFVGECALECVEDKDSLREDSAGLGTDI